MTIYAQNKKCNKVATVTLHLAQMNQKDKHAKTECGTETENITCKSKKIHKISNACNLKGGRHEHTAEIRSININRTQYVKTHYHGKQWYPSTTYPPVQHMMLEQLQ